MAGQADDPDITHKILSAKLGAHTIFLTDLYNLFLPLPGHEMPRPEELPEMGRLSR
jgi:hypothetical protein